MLSLKRNKLLCLSCLLFLGLLNHSPVTGYQNGTVADDVTLIGTNNAIYSLEEAKSANILTADGTQATLEINDVVVEDSRILVRVLIWGLPVSWGDKVNTPGRLYGDYLPVAELGLPSEKWLTPSSNSRYSLLSNGNTLVVAALLEFLSDEEPSTIAFNFNQIPFDQEPLSEGIALVLTLTEGDSQERVDQSGLSDTREGITFTLMNTAQTTDNTMIQPGLSTVRPDEKISRVGWVSVLLPDDKRYLLTRSDAYGFNLTDDSETYVNNSYHFSALSDSQPLKIGMDYVYVYREYPSQLTLTFDEAPVTGSKGDLNIPLDLGDFQATVTGYQMAERNEEAHIISVLRLFIDSDPQIAQIPFRVTENEAESTFADCGFLPDTDQFACDVMLNQTGTETLNLYFDQFEYRIDGNWQIEWNPVGLAFAKPSTGPEYVSIQIDTASINPTEISENQEAFDLMSSFSDELAADSGWISEITERTVAVANPEFPDLVQHGVKLSMTTHTTIESWDEIDDSGFVVSNVTLIKNQQGELLNGTWSRTDGQIILPESYFVSYSNPDYGAIYPYLYGIDFYSLLDTSAKFIQRENCTYEDSDVWCYTYEHALSVSSEQDSYKNRYLFWIDPKTGKILNQVTECQLNGIKSPLVKCIGTKTINVSRQTEPDQEIQSLIDQIQF